MKKLIVLSLFLTSTLASADSLQVYFCKSNHRGVTATDAVGGVNGSEELTVYSQRKGSAAEETVYFRDTTGEAPIGSTMMLEDDVNVPGWQQKPGSYASEKAEIELNKREAKTYAFAFLFQGVAFYCQAL